MIGRNLGGFLIHSGVLHTDVADTKPRVFEGCMLTNRMRERGDLAVAGEGVEDDVHAAALGERHHLLHKL